VIAPRSEAPPTPAPESIVPATAPGFFQRIATQVKSFFRSLFG
jgi:hypothetical protein